MADELSDENRALLEECIANVLGREVRKVSARDLVQVLPDPAEALSRIRADEEASRLYVRQALRGAGLPDLSG